jgi:predicted thioesterase
MGSKDSPGNEHVDTLLPGAEGTGMADLTKLRVGLKGSASLPVTEARLATEVGSGKVPVFASPMLVAVMEAASVACIDKHLPEGHESLGVHLDISHTAPTPLGSTVTATATLEAIDGRKLTFCVNAHDGIESIGSGTHTRVVVDTRRFTERLSAKSPPRQ